MTDQVKKYFLEYSNFDAEVFRKTKEYSLGSDLRKKLEGIAGLVIESNANPLDPTAIVSMPASKYDEVKTIEGIVKIYDDIQFEIPDLNPFQKKV